LCDFRAFPSSANFGLSRSGKKSAWDVAEISEILEKTAPRFMRHLQLIDEKRPAARSLVA